jgi:hypothetical protein
METRGCFEHFELCCFLDKNSLTVSPKTPSFQSDEKKILDTVKVVVDQDAAILSKIYPDSQRKIKLNNEVGMDWVDRNYDNFPSIDLPNLSKSYSDS